MVLLFWLIHFPVPVFKISETSFASILFYYEMTIVSSCPNLMVLLLSTYPNFNAYFIMTLFIPILVTCFFAASGILVSFFTSHTSMAYDIDFFAKCSYIWKQKFVIEKNKMPLHIQKIYYYFIYGWIYYNAFPETKN